MAEKISLVIWLLENETKTTTTTEKPNKNKNKFHDDDGIYPRNKKRKGNNPLAMMWLI